MLDACGGQSRVGFIFPVDTVMIFYFFCCMFSLRGRNGVGGKLSAGYTFHSVTHSAEKSVDSPLHKAKSVQMHTAAPQ